MLVLQRHQFILMDGGMLEWLGRETTRRLRAHAVTNLNPRMPIIAPTVRARESGRQPCRRAGLDGFVHQPRGLGERQVTRRRRKDLR